MIQKLSILLLTFITLLSLACGGGTTGTGAYETRTFHGQLRDEAGQPASGYIVELPESNLSTTTDSNGNFILQAETGLEVIFIFNKDGISSSVTVSNLTAGFGEYRLKFLTNSQTNTVVLESVEIIPNDENAGQTQTPGPSPDDTSSENEDDDTGSASPAPQKFNTIKGLIINTDDAPVSGILVRLPDYDKSKLSDSAGKVSFTTETDGEPLVIMVSGPGIQTAIFEIALPNESVTVKFTIRIYSEEGGLAGTENLPSLEDLQITSAATV